MKYLSISMPIAACGLALIMSGCVVEPGRVYVRPPVVAVAPPVVVAPAPVVVAPEPVVEVPDSYVMVDGVGYVGFVGDACFYLGPGNVWITCDPVRLGRFHDWERFHPDWRVRLAVRNDRFRNDRNGHFVPRRDERAPVRGEERRENRRDDRKDDHH